MKVSLILKTVACSAATLVLSAQVTAQGPSRDRTVTVFAKPVPPTLEAQKTKIAPGMSPIDVLLVKDAIREQWANYPLLLDGDGTSIHIGEWAELTFTKDMKWVWYDVNGETTGQTTRDDFTDQKPTVAPTPANPHPYMTRLPSAKNMQRSAKHLPISIKFDEITPTTAKTRTMVMMFDVPPAKVPNRADGPPDVSTPSVPQAAVAIYHDTWRKENDTWLKSVSILYSAHCGWFPEKKDNFSCMDRGPPPKAENALPAQSK